MAKYTFKCDACSSKIQLFCNAEDINNCESCGLKMRLCMPILAGQDVKETVNKHLGTIWQQGQKELITERKADYYWDIEVPKMVNSGVYTLSTMLENGWVYYDEKGALQTRTTPLQKS